jgi:hypothetical protein
MDHSGTSKDASCMTKGMLSMYQTGDASVMVSEQVGQFHESTHTHHPMITLGCFGFYTRA